MELKGKIAVIAGATGDIGSRIAKELVLEGAEVILVGRKKEDLVKISEKIKEKGGSTTEFATDLTREGTVVELAKKIKGRYGKVDIIVNAAGVGIYKNFEDLTYGEWMLSMDVNLNSVFLIIQNFLPLLKKSKKAYVINMGSGMGKISVASRSAYCTSKFALRGLIKTLQKEYLKTNINFVLLTLGSVLTSFGPLSLEDKKSKQKRGKKYIDPDWLAEYIVTKIKHDTFEPETSIYPKNYFEESKKGKT